MANELIALSFNVALFKATQGDMGPGYVEMGFSSGTISLHGEMRSYLLSATVRISG